MDYEATAKKIREHVFDMLDRSRGDGVIHASDLDTVIEGVLRRAAPEPQPWNYRVALDGYPIGEPIAYYVLCDDGVVLCNGQPV